MTQINKEIFASVISMLVYAVGGLDAYLKTLIILMIIDYLSGVFASVLFNKSDKTKTGKLSSKAMISGVAKKIYIMLLVIIAYRFDIMLNIEYARLACITAFIISELLSIIEKTEYFGIKIPSVFYKLIELLNEKEN